MPERRIARKFCVVQLTIKVWAPWDWPDAKTEKLIDRLEDDIQLDETLQLATRLALVGAGYERELEDTQLHIEVLT